METHLTIYLDPAVVRDGGLVIVSAIPMPDAEWQAMPVSDDVAMLDPTNPKGADVGPEDRHFGVIIRSPAASVEFPVPESGTYTFNLLPMPTMTTEKIPLMTVRIGIGSASLLSDPDTGEVIDWPTVSTIAVNGRIRQEHWAQAVDKGFFKTWRQARGVHYERRVSGDIRVIELTDTGIAFAMSPRSIP